MPVNAEIEATPAVEPEDQSRLITDLIAKIAPLLPPQGPVSAFTFLNVLEALEELPFEEGVRKGARIFGCRPYLAEDQYQRHLANGRIHRADLLIELLTDLGERSHEQIGSLGPLLHLRTAMLSHPLRSGPVEELRWFVAETDALTKMSPEAPLDMRERMISSTRDWMNQGVKNASETTEGKKSVASHQRLLADLMEHFGDSSSWNSDTWEEISLKALWRICREGVHGVDVPWQRPSLPVRQHDLLLEFTGVDSDALVNDLLIRFCASYADQGLADWALPNRAEGFFRAFVELFRQRGGPPDRWRQNLGVELERMHATGVSPAESIQESLHALGVPAEEWEEYLTATVCALKGWAALLYQMEVRSDRVPIPAREGTLLEYVAVRMILERCALQYVAQTTLPESVPLSELRSYLIARVRAHRLSSIEQRALSVFQLAQVLGWFPATLIQLTRDQWTKLVTEIEAFGNLERRRIFHNAYERRYRTKALDAIAIRAAMPARRVERPRFQACFCIDAREESFRRYLEEIVPDVETFGAPGFFSVPIYYKGVADAHFAALCPIVVRPKHWMIEEVVSGLEETHRTRAQTRKVIGTASHRLHRGSFGATAGALLTASLGVLASVPLVARVLFPRLTAQIRRSANSYVEPPRRTRLRLERKSVEPGPEGDGIGFSLPEMANIAERVLRDIGLTHNFSRLMIFFGHGSSCLNNPHKSAYDCGACTGSAGGPNARALALMLNDPRVREILNSRGLKIPADTIFLGGLHNTGDDTCKFFDLDLLPDSHRADLASAEKTLADVCRRNAHERCRRFQSAPLNLTPEAAHRHAEGRTEDLAQTRPEFGNATNALCFVGRRERIRGLFMDRRCFMHSYDPTADDENFSILGRILAPVVPVCEGINLTYFFSYIDSPGWGSGTKLPHNVASLLGVMDGYQSDLRCGLPFQSVEIHEPMRCLFVIESTPEAMENIMARDAVVRRILRNNWAQLALLDPHSAEIHWYRKGEFRIYHPESLRLGIAPTSLSWYQGHREHLEFALIEDAFVKPEYESRTSPSGANHGS